MLYIIKPFFEMVFMTTVVSPCFYTRYDAPKSVPLGDKSHEDNSSNKYSEVLESLGGNGSDDDINPIEEPENCEDHDGYVQSSNSGGYNNTSIYVHPEVFNDHEVFVQSRVNRSSINANPRKEPGYYNDNGDSDVNANSCEEPGIREDHDGFVLVGGDDSDYNANPCKEPEDCEDNDGFVQGSDNGSSDDFSFDDDGHDDINPYADPEVFEDYGSVIQVGESNPNTDTNRHVRENNKYAYGGSSLINYDIVNNEKNTLSLCSFLVEISTLKPSFSNKN